jgi:hypothetical protein
MPATRRKVSGKNQPRKRTARKNFLITCQPCRFLPQTQSGNLANIQGRHNR